MVRQRKQRSGFLHPFTKPPLMWKLGDLTSWGVLEEDSEPPNPSELKRTQVSGMSLTRRHVIALILTFLQ